MAKYEIIITDVTCYNTLFCVAGWDISRKAMVRPEPPDSHPNVEASRFWDMAFAGPSQVFSLGNIVTFEASDPPVTFRYPHRTEDKVVSPATQITVTGALSLADVALAVATGVSASVPAAFDGSLVRAPSAKAFVPRDHQVRSLGAVEVAPGHIHFHENLYKPDRPKLRATIVDAGTTYDLPVTSEATIARWKAVGLAGLRVDLALSKRVHVRLGLSRPFFARPDECYAQANGLYFL